MADSPLKSSEPHSALVVLLVVDADVGVDTNNAGLAQLSPYTRPGTPAHCYALCESNQDG